MAAPPTRDQRSRSATPSPTQAGTCGYLDQLRAAQAAVVDADADATVVETLDLTRNIYDPWHYDGPGGRQLAARFADAVLGKRLEVPVSAALKVQSYAIDYDGDPGTRPRRAGATGSTTPRSTR